MVEGVHKILFPIGLRGDNNIAGGQIGGTPYVFGSHVSVQVHALELYVQLYSWHITLAIYLLSVTQ